MRDRLRRRVMVVTIGFCVGWLGRPGVAQSPARDVVRGAIAAMGGPSLEALEGLRLETIGHYHALEQSERPEGPWLSIYRQRTETRDLRRRAIRHTSQSRFWSFPEWSPAVPTVVADGVAARVRDDQWSPGSVIDLRDAADTFALAPERLLFTARDAEELRSGEPVTLQGVDQDVVAFGHDGRSMRLYLNQWTHLPTMLEIHRADETFGIWGDVVERRWYSFWTLEDGGILYPRQTTVDWNGLPSSDVTVMQLEVNPDLDPADFAIPAETRQRFEVARERPVGLASLRFDSSTGSEVAPGVFQFTGPWNILVVRQDDGLVVVEAPIGNSYSTGVLDALEMRFPGLSVLGIVTTSDAWPHLGGVREYVARDVPIHALDLNVPILTRLVEATRSADPDRLARAPRDPRWRVVTDATALGSGATAMQLLPIRGELGERMMAIWFPAARLLYASDMVQHDRDGSFFMPSMLAEIEALVTRHGLDPATVVAMHAGPTPWADITAALAAIRSAGG